MPPLASNFEEEIRKSNELISRLELSNAALANLRGPEQIGLTSLELVYELAYLRLFIAWEYFLEQTFLRLMCGFIPVGGVQEPTKSGFAYLRSIASAEAVMLDGKPYRLWHNPEQVRKRAKKYFLNGSFEIVLSSQLSTLEDFAAVRHRIAHAQKHARSQFDQATMTMASRRYRASRPGRFLRDWTSASTTPIRWFDHISLRLLGLAKQLCP